MNLDKNSRIKQTMRETAAKRAFQSAFVFDIKILTNKLSKVQKETLFMLFVEKKWLYNHILATDSIFTRSYKDRKTINLDKDKKPIEHELVYLPAKVVQCIIREMQQSIFKLSKSKKSGNKIGKLKFRSECNSIELNQFNNTHRIVNKNRIKIQGVPGKLYVRGFAQIPEDSEFADAKLVKKPDGYHLMLTCYRSRDIVEKERKEHIQLHHNNQKDGGIDLNIKNTIVTSEGKSYSCRVEESGRTKSLQRKLSKHQKRSNNWQKIRSKLQRSYQKTNNRKKDQANKIMHDLKHDFDRVYMQDENLSGWQKGWFGKQVHQSCLGTIKAKLPTLKISRWLPTTKFCYHCGCTNEIKLSDRIFVCKRCGHTENRDVKSAKTILFFGRFKYDKDRFDSIYEIQNTFGMKEFQACGD